MMSTTAVSVSPKLRMVAAGRGRTMCEPRVLQAVLTMLPGIPSDKTIELVYLGTATYDKDEPFVMQTHAYSALPNCNVTKLNVSEAAETVPNKAEIQATLDAANIIMVSGGNTLYAMNRWKELGIDRMIRELVDTKNPAPVLCGGSAGAICWFESGHSDSLDPTTFLTVDPNLTDEQKKDWEYIRVDGLKYVPAMCVPHHNATQSNGLPRSQDSDAMLLRFPDRTCIGIDEAAALVISDSRAWVVSADGEAECCVKIVVTEKGDIHIKATPFRQSSGSISVENMLRGMIR